MEISRVLDDAPVRFASATEDGAEVGTGVDIECGNSRFRLYGQAADEFPEFPDVDFDSAWEMSAGELQALIERTSFAVSTEDSRPILNGISLAAARWRDRDGGDEWPPFGEDEA